MRNLCVYGSAYFWLVCFKMFSLFLLLGNSDLIKFFIFGTRVGAPSVGDSCLAKHVRTFLNSAPVTLKSKLQQKTLQIRKRSTKEDNSKRTWTRASSPSCEHDNVGVVPRNPESVTSSTVSPIDRTSVAFTNDTMMYASYSSVHSKKQDWLIDWALMALFVQIGYIVLW